MNTYQCIAITRSLSAACAALLAVTSVGFAQAAQTKSEDEEGVVKLSPFTVSNERDVGYFTAETTAGTRIRQALVDIPGSTSVINKELIDDLMVVEITKAVNYGVSGVTSLDNLQEDFSIRGFREIGNFRDGVSSTAFFPTQTYDIDRIEVLKGPVALSLGNGSILGGAVNMVSRKPTAVPVREVDVQFGEKNLVRSTLNLSGPLTAAKDVRYRVTAGAQNDDRWKEIERDNNIFFGGALDTDFGRSTVSFYAYHYETDAYRYFNDFLDISGFLNGVPDGYLRLNPLSKTEFSPARGDDVFYDNAENYLTAQIVTQLKKNLSFRAFYRYRDLEDRRRILRGITVQADNFTLNRQDIPFAIDNRLHTIQTDVLYQVEFAKMKHDLSFGIDFSRGNDRQALVVVPGITPLDTRNPNFASDSSLLFGAQTPPFTTNAGNESETFSYYIQDYISMFNGKLILSGGLRWVDSVRYSVNRITNTTTRTQSPVDSAPRYSLMYKPWTSVSVYVTKAETVPSGQGNNQRGEPLPDTFGELEEIGFKFFDVKALGGSIFGSVAYFEMAKTNTRVILPDIDPQTGFNIITTTTGDTSTGFEIDLGYRVEAGPGQLDVIFTHYDAEARTNSGGRSPFAPDRVTSILLKYEFNEGALNGFAVGLGRYDEGDKAASANPAFMIEPIETYELFMNYGLKDWRFGLSVGNLTDERRVERLAANGLVQSTDPRRIRANVGYSW